jgi:two-component system, cell cycle response regulator
MHILVVDDSRVIRRAAFKILEKEFSVLEAEDGVDAWKQIQENKTISVVFSDLGMPNMDGYELLEKIRSSDNLAIARLPVIIITGAEESDGAKQKVFEHGATDFISKPFDSIALRTRAHAHIKYRSEVHSLEQRVATDKVTGLYTEGAFKQQGEQALAYAQRHGNALTVVRIDIEHFADIFVKHGREVAEQILAKVASIIRDVLRKEDSAARMGVSKFGLLLVCSDGEGARQAVARICQRVASLKMKLGSDIFQIKFSAGITSPQIIDDDTSFDGLLVEAEHALQQSVDEGGGKVIVFQTGKQVAVAAPAIARVDVNVEDLLKQIAAASTSIRPEQLASAMHKLIPLIEHADQRLKLGLGKVILHLKQKLK